MRCLVLDVDAVVHAKGLGLHPTLEKIFSALGGQVFVDLKVYREMIRSGLGPVLDGWQRAALLQDPVDYRRLEKGDAAFVKTASWGERGLSREDRASLVVALSKEGSGLLTCERLLSDAAESHGVLPLDLFDVIRYAAELGALTREQCETLCEPWVDRFRAGRPRDYSGSFATELERRKAARPLPPLVKS